MQKFQDIIERVEHVRIQLGKNKSKFAAEIDMKPQTYNNFIGSQASKPNVELIYGVVNSYDVHPLWMLTGKGPIFQSSKHASSLENKKRFELRSAFQWDNGVQEDDVSSPISEEEILKESLDDINPLMEDLDAQIQQLERSQMPTMERMVYLLQRYFRVQPLLVCEEMKKMLVNLQKQLTKQENSS